MDIKQIKAIEQKNKQKWEKHFGAIPDTSGIYILTRAEKGFRYAYVGQAKHILTRLAEHLQRYQHIDLSLKKHGLISPLKPHGWNLSYVLCEESELDEREQYYIQWYANCGFQMRNKTAGGQSTGKFDIAEAPKKGYQQGLHKGYENAQKDVAKWFAKNLTYGINGAPNKNKEKALQKFEEFLKNAE